MKKIDINKARDIMENFKQKRVVVVGDFYLDEYIHTESKQFSPEAPVPRAVIKEKEHLPGAAGNVASGFSALGANVVSIGVIGNDHNGKIMIRELKKKGIDTSCLVVDANRVTGTFTRVIIKGEGNINQHVIRIDHENNNKMPSLTKNKIFSALKNEIPKADAVFIADYDEARGTGLVDKGLVKEIILLAKKNNKLTIGISRLNIGFFKNIDIVIANRNETELVTNIKISDDKTLEKAARSIREQLNCQIVLISLGKEGVIAFDGKKFVRLPSFAKKVVDVCGAGDSLSVTFCLSRLASAGIEDASVLASFAASVVVGKPGTATASTKEIDDAILIGSGEKSKVLETEELVGVLEELKDKNKKVVFTNGYFDLIHVGHINFLREAKNLGDILVLAINSDESTRANKGADRPLISQDDRARILAGFDFIDYITIFDELTPIKVIKKLRPNILAKGGSYSEEEVVGNEIVKAAGGSVVIIPTLGPSTESLFKHIKTSKKYLHEK